MTEVTPARRRAVTAEAGSLFALGVAVLVGLRQVLRAADVAAASDVLAAVVVLWIVVAGYTAVTLRTAPNTHGRSLGLATMLTVARGGLYGVVAAFVLVAPVGRLAWVPAVCYAAGVALDWVDGSVARTVGRVTPTGRRLDMAFDTFGFVAAPVLGVAWGQLPVWYLSLSAARYVYRAAKYQRRYRGAPMFDRPDGDLGRYLAGGQMVFLALALTPVTTPGLVASVAPFALAPSVGVFLRDYLVVSGRLSTDTVRFWDATVDR